MEKSAIQDAIGSGILSDEGAAALTTRIDESLAELSARTGAPAEFTGRLDRASLERELAGAAMLLMPSRYHEFAGYSALEAMAAGVPVVASCLGALPELLGAKRCVPPGDAAALAGRMTSLWESPEARRAEGDELIERARANHGEERYVSRLLDLYSRARSAAISRPPVPDREASSRCRRPPRRD